MKTKFAYFALLLAMVGCGGKQAGMQVGDNEYAVETVQTTDAELETTYPATIKGLEDIEIRPKVSGFITKLCVDEGDFVKKGQTLFLLDRVQFEAAVRSAEAQLKVLRTNISTQELTVKNKKMLHEKNIISDYDLQVAENQLETLRAQLSQAQAQLTDARNSLSYCTVTSPVDGVVGNIPYRLGSLVSGSSAQPLTTVSNINKMYVYFSMTEKQLLGLTREQGGIQKAVENMPAVSLVLADGTKYGSTGTVSAVSGVIDVTTGSVNMRATFDNAERLLRSGGTGSIIVPTRQAGAIVIPQKATYEIQDKKFVYTVGKDNKVVSTEITVMPQNDGASYVVMSGLKAGDRIVVEGVRALKNGMEIKPITPQQSQARKAKAQNHMKEGKLPTED